MKFSIRNLIGTFAHVQDATMRGRIAGEDARRQQEAQDFAQYSQLVQQQQAQEDHARQDQVGRINALGHALDNPGIDDATAAQFGQQYTDAVNGLAQPAGADPRVSQFNQLLTNSPYAQRLQKQFGPIGGGNAAPGGGAAPVGPGAGGVAGPTVPVQNLPRGNSVAAPGAAPAQADGQLNPRQQYAAPEAQPQVPGAADPSLAAGTDVPGPQGAPPANVPAAGTQPGTPDAAPGTAPGTVPGTAPAGSGFQSVRTRTADAEVGQSLQQLEQQANQNGDAATAAAALDLRTRLVRREITGADAQAKMAQLQREGAQTRAYGENFSRQAQNLGAQISRGQIQDQTALQEANQIYGEMQALGLPTTPEARKQAQLLQGRLSKLYSSGAIGATANDRTLDEQRNLGITNTILSQYNQGMNALKGAKGMPAEWILARVKALSTYSKDPRVQRYFPAGLDVPEDIDPTPRTHDVGGQQVMETDAEAKARALEAASAYVDDPKESSRIKGQALTQLFGLIRSPQWKAMQDPKNPAMAAQRQQIIESVNTLLQDAGSDVKLPKDIITTLTPQERALNDDRTAKRADRKRRTDAYVQNLGELDSYREDILDLKRRADERAQYKLDHPAAAGGGSKEDDRHFQYLRSRLNHLLSDLDKQTTNYGPYSPEMIGDDPQAQKDAAKALDPLKQQINQIKSEMGPLMGTGAGAGGKTTTTTTVDTERRYRVKVNGKYLEDAPGKGVSEEELRKAFLTITNPQTKKPYTAAEADAKIASLRKRTAPK